MSTMSSLFIDEWLFSLEMFIPSLYQWLILSLGSLLQRDGAPFTNLNEVMKKKIVKD